MREETKAFIRPNLWFEKRRKGRQKGRAGNFDRVIKAATKASGGKPTIPSSVAILGITLKVGRPITLLLCFCRIQYYEPGAIYSEQTTLALYCGENDCFSG